MRNWQVEVCAIGKTTFRAFEISCPIRVLRRQYNAGRLIREPMFLR